MALTPGETVRGWFTVDGQRLGANARGDTPHFRTRGYSLQGGIDATVGETGRIGAAFGYGQNHYRDNEGGTGHDTSFRASLVASQPVGPIGLSAIVSYAHDRETTERETGIGHAYAKHNVNQFLAGAQAVAPFTWHGVIATPAVGVLVSRISGGDFVEQGSIPAAFRVAVDYRTRSFVSPYGTFQLAYPMTDTGGTVWTPDVEIGYRRSDVAKGGAVVLTAADGTVFDDNRVDLARSNILPARA
nr:autotransporter outer membrane beta-barrel domain-containing protein [Sphingomonas chungangi]